MKNIKAGMPWDEATKRIVTELGPPTYSLAPGEKNTASFLFDEQWWWICEGKNSRPLTSIRVEVVRVVVSAPARRSSPSPDPTQRGLRVLPPP